MKPTINKMKRLLSGLTLTLLIMSSTAYGQKRYHVKAAEVKYETVSPEGKGTKTLKFDNYGMREVVHTKIIKNGKVKKDELTIINNGKGYVVNLLQNTATDISERLNASMSMMKPGDGDYSRMGKDMLKSMGGKQTGTENFLGKDCEKWELDMMGKMNFLFWNGVPLKTESKIMGMTISEIAKSIDTDVAFSDSEFKVPSGVKIEKYDSGFSQFGDFGGDDNNDREEMKQQMEKMKNMSYPEFKKLMKREDPDASDEDIKQAYDMMKKMGDILK